MPNKIADRIKENGRKYFITLDFWKNTDIYIILEKTLPVQLGQRQKRSTFFTLEGKSGNVAKFNKVFVS